MNKRNGSSVGKGRPVGDAGTGVGIERPDRPDEAVSFYGSRSCQRAGIEGHPADSLRRTRVLEQMIEVLFELAHFLQQRGAGRLSDFQQDRGKLGEQPPAEASLVINGDDLDGGAEQVEDARGAARFSSWRRRRKRCACSSV